MSDKNKTNDRSVIYHTCIIFAHLVYEWILYSISGSSRSIPHTTPHAHMRKGFSKSIWSSLLKCTVYCRLQRWSLSKALSQTQMVAEPYIHTYIHTYIHDLVYLSIYIHTCCIYIHLHTHKNLLSVYIHTYIYIHTLYINASSSQVFNTYSYQYSPVSLTSGNQTDIEADSLSRQQLRHGKTIRHRKRFYAWAYIQRHTASSYVERNAVRFTHTFFAYIHNISVHTVFASLMLLAENNDLGNVY
jgi:hypothetical protein